MYSGNDLFIKDEGTSSFPQSSALKIDSIYSGNDLFNKDAGLTSSFPQSSALKIKIPDKNSQASLAFLSGIFIYP
jgi:hypothetical protein